MKSNTAIEAVKIKTKPRISKTAPAAKGRMLILGAKGNLGSELVKAFSADREVIGWDREEIDVCDKTLISRKIGELKPAIIINATAYNAVDLCEEKTGLEAARKLNVLAPGYLAQAALAAGAMLVHYSTDYVFDGRKKSGYKETDTPKPLNKYGETKRQGEEEIIKLSGRGLKWYLVRTSKLFGPKGVSDVSKPSFFDTMLKLAREKNRLEVVDEEMSCFTYTPDLAAATKALLESGKGYGIYHLVNPGGVTWYQAAAELFKQAKIKVKVVPVKADKFPRPARRPKFSILRNTKFRPLRLWREALREYLKNQSKS